MITKTKLMALVADQRIASVRVVPVPLESVWCIDLIIRVPYEIGSQSETLAKQAPGNNKRQLRRFDTIDAAAAFLGDAGITTFVVDSGDSITSVSGENSMTNVIETSAQLWLDDEESTA